MFLELLLLASLAACVYWRYWALAGYWTSIGVPQPRYATFLFGNSAFTSLDYLGDRTHYNSLSVKQYKEFEGAPYYGTYAFGVTPAPVLVVRDLDIVRNVYGEGKNTN